MKRLYLAATVLLSCSVAFGATITGNLLLVTGSASPDRRVTFQPMDPPWSDGINLYLPDPTSVTSVDGVFSATLAAGSYRVTVGGQNVGYIRVPVGTDTYSMTQLPAAHFAYLSAIEGGDNVTVTTNATGAIVISATSEIQTAWDDLTGVPANITAWSSIDPTTKQPASANLTNWSAIATSTKQDADADLTRFAAIGAGTAGDILYRDAAGWTNLAKGTDGEVLKLTSGYPSWEADEGTSGEWGSITGTLSLQSDLAGVLDSKAATNHVHDTADISTGLLSADRLPVNSELTGGIVSQPTASDTNSFWQTDANGVPGWRRLENLDVGTVTATNLSLASGLGEDGQVVTKSGGVLTWGTAATGETAGTVHAPDGATTANRIATFKDTSGTNLTQAAVTVSDLATVTDLGTATNNAYTSAQAFANSLTNTVVTMSTNAAQANATAVFAPKADPTFTGTINGENLELSGSVGGTTLYWTGGLPGHIYMDATTNLANVDATAEAAFDALSTNTFTGTGTIPLSSVTDAKAPLDSPVFTTILTLPSGANPTANAEGEIAWDSDDDSLTVYNGSEARSIPTIKVCSITIMDPDGVQAVEDAVPILPVETSWAPFGITIKKIHVKIDAAVSYAITLEEWTDPATYGSDIEAVTVSSGTEADDDGSIADASVAAGSIVFVDLPTTAANFVMVTFTYIVNPGD